MASTKTPRRSNPAPTVVEPVDLPNHQQGLACFDSVLEMLHMQGWNQHRVDTLRHATADPTDRKAETIRHHYDHGVWELSLEPDKYWNPAAKPIRVVKIRLDRPLPEPLVILEELLGR